MSAEKLIVIPASDIPTYHRLKRAVQEKIEFWRKAVNEVVASKLPRMDALAWVASMRGIKEKTLHGQFYRAMKFGWRGLINRRLLGDACVSVSPEFLPYWHGLVLENKRNTAKAFSRFVADYHRGEPIPGIPPRDERLDKLPRGYGQRNLVRPKYLPPRASVDMARQGIAAARAHLPHGPQDISHIRPLEYVVFDDVELDFLIIVPGVESAVKLRLLVAMDLCSRVILGYGFRPAIPRPDGAEDGLKLRDMKAVVARLLRTWGVPRDYLMHFICERATAALPEAAKTALAEISGGQIIVHDTSMIVGQVFEFRDKATGNSWGKAWLESFFGSLHAELADQPGQKGRRYDLAPAELDGRKKELLALVRAGKRLPLAMRYAFQWPFRTAAEALQELDSAFSRLNARTDHGLLCFDQVALWKMTPDDKWKHESEMPEWLISQAANLLSANLLWDRRPESPMERFRKLLPPQDERREIADCSLQRLMEEFKRVRFMDLQFQFEREKTDYVYLPTDALLSLLTEGDHFLLWFHPDEMGTVYVTRDRPHLGYVGKLTRFTAGRRGDLDQAKEYLREKHRIFAHAVSKAQGPAIDRLTRRGDALAANTEIITDSLRTLEVEVDVVSPKGSVIHQDAPESIRTMTQDREQQRQDKASRTSRERADRRAADFGAHIERPEPEEAPAIVETWDAPEPNFPTTPTETW